MTNNIGKVMADAGNRIAQENKEAAEIRMFGYTKARMMDLFALPRVSPHDTLMAAMSILSDAQETPEEVKYHGPNKRQMINAAKWLISEAMTKLPR